MKPTRRTAKPDKLTATELGKHESDAHGSGIPVEGSVPTGTAICSAVSSQVAYAGSTTIRSVFVPQLIHAVRASLLLVIFAWEHLPRLPHYSGFAAGPSTYLGENPSRNTLAAVVFMVGILGMLGLSQLISLLLERKRGPATIISTASLFWMLLVPDALFAGVYLVQPGYAFSLLYLGFGLEVLLLLALLAVSYSRATPAADTTKRVLTLYLFAILLSGATSFALNAAISRMSPAVLLQTTPFGVLIPALVCGTILCGAVVLCRDERQLESWCHRAVFALQILLPLSFLTVIPPAWNVGGQAMTSFIVSPYLNALLLCLIVGSQVQLARRYIAWRRSRTAVKPWNVSKALVPMCMAAVLVAATHHPSFGTGKMNPDDYHMGEELLPYEQYHDFGLVPFADLNSPRGIRPFLGGAANQWFFTGKAETLSAGNDLIGVSALLACFFCAEMLVPAPFAFLLVYLFSPFYGQLVLVGPALFLLAALLGRYPTWVALVWSVVVGLLVVPYTPSGGASYALAAAGALGLTYWFADRRRPEADSTIRHRKLAIGLGAFVLFILFLFNRLYVGLARYLWENASVNGVIHGNEFRDAAPIGKVGVLSTSLGHLGIYFSLFLSAVLFVFIFVRGIYGNAEGVSRKRQLFLSAAGFLFVLCALPYTTGRLEPGGLSRPGYYSLWLIASVWPVVLYVHGWLSKPIRYCGLTLLMGLAYSAGYPAPPRTIEEMQQISALVVPTNPADIGSPNSAFPVLGRAALEPQHQLELGNLKSILQRYVRPGETYFDMTNHSARYYYLQYRVPAVEAAVYNAAAPATQIRMIEAFKNAPPPVVLVDALNIYHDGGKNALRVNYLYRYVVRNYVPVTEGTYTLMVRPDRVAADANRTTHTDALVNVDPQPCDLNDVNWKHGVSIIPGRAGFTDCDGASVTSLRIGDVVEFAGSGKRTILATNRDQIWVSGTPLDPERDGSPHPVRADLTATPSGIRPCSLTDANWKNGISVLPGRSGFTMCDTTWDAGLKPGDAVTLTHSGRRAVVSVDGPRVWVGGAMLDPVGDGFPNTIMIEQDGAAEFDRDRYLLAQMITPIFFMPDLQLLPSSWGHSELTGSLRDHIAIPDADVHLTGCSRDSRGFLTLPSGPADIVIDTRRLKLDGGQADVLSFTAEGTSRAKDKAFMTVQLFWNSELTAGREMAHARFGAMPGPVLVPLDSHPAWLLSKHIGSLRIRIADAAAFDKAAIGNLGLWRKR